MLISTTPEPFSLPDSLKYNPDPNSFKPVQLPASVASTHPHVDQNSFNPQPNRDLISKLGASPEVEQQLRKLANRFGFDTNRLPDAGTMNVIKRFFGSKLLENLPMNYANGVNSLNPPDVQNIPEGIKPIKPVNVEDKVSLLHSHCFVFIISSRNLRESTKKRL